MSQTINGCYQHHFRMTRVYIAGDYFSLVDSTGNAVKGDDMGLLLFRGGTVCDHDFNKTVADAICKYLNSSDDLSSSHSAVYWTSGSKFDLQNNLDISLLSLQCSTEELESCDYGRNRLAEGCEHHMDVFLKCHSGKDSRNLRIVP